MLLQPIWLIVQSVSQTQKSLAAMERIFTVLQMMPDKPDVPGALPAPQQVEHLRFDQVSFAYRVGVPVIRDLTLDVPGGFTVAIVGASGAGKTTLTDLVARFHDPDSGRIELNGVDLRQISTGRLPQDARDRAAETFSLTARSGRTLSTAATGQPMPRSLRPLNAPTPTALSESCRKATTRSSASVEPNSPAASVSVSASPVRSWPTRKF